MYTLSHLSTKSSAGTQYNSEARKSCQGGTRHTCLFVPISLGKVSKIEVVREGCRRRENTMRQSVTTSIGLQIHDLRQSATTSIVSQIHDLHFHFVYTQGARALRRHPRTTRVIIKLTYPFEYYCVRLAACYYWPIQIDRCCLVDCYRVRREYAASCDSQPATRMMAHHRHLPKS
jgi:hypothetical protein